MMHLLFNWAMRWELIPFQFNPMNLVHVKGSSKREREPRTLTAEEFRQFIEHVPEPCRTMCVVTACLGLRVRFTDSDFRARTCTSPFKEYQSNLA
jgi:integrase